jgi:hypothetical protein
LIQSLLERGSESQTEYKSRSLKIAAYDFTPNALGKKASQRQVEKRQE